jgi:hypothetical protein
MQRIKKITTPAVALLLLAGLITSCSVEKRIYRPGFFVQHASGKSKITPPEKETALKEAPASASASASAQPDITPVSPVASGIQGDADQPFPEVNAEKPVAVTTEKTSADGNASRSEMVKDTIQHPVKNFKNQKLPMHPKLKAAGIFIIAGVGFIALVTLLVLFNNAFLIFSFPVVLGTIITMLFRLAFIAVICGGVLAVLGLLELRKQKEPVYGSKKGAILLLIAAGIVPLYNFVRILLSMIRRL